MDFDVADVVQRAATGTLPSVERVAAIVDEAYERLRGDDDGAVADYIPALAAADPDLFGIAVVGVQGASTSKGDADHLFSIQSVSKAFVYALVCNARGHETVLHQVGVNNTGLPFNSVVAIELNDGHPMNPMVNAGAIATTALAPGDSASQQWDFLLDGLSGFAGRQLVVDADVYSSERATNQRNRAIARLLDSYGRMGGDTMQSVDLYTRQCSLLVSASDLALMGATLANGGVNPATGDRVVSEKSVGTPWPCWRQTVCTSGPVSGSSRSGCRRSRGWRAASSASRRAKAAWAPSLRAWTQPATASEARVRRRTCPAPWA